MKEFIKTLLWLSAVLATSMCVVLTLESCRTSRVSENEKTHQHTDTTTQQHIRYDVDALWQQHQDSLMHAFIERILQYENHSSRLDTLRNDSSLIVVDDSGNIVKEYHWRTEYVKDWRRDTLIVYRDKTDSTRIISRYNDSLMVLRNEIDYYRSCIADLQQQSRVVENKPTFWQRIQMWWKDVVVGLIVIAIIYFAVKRYLANH